MSWVAAIAAPDDETAGRTLALPILLIGFVAFMLWAGAIRRSRSPYMVVDFTAGAIVTVSTFGRLKVVLHGTDGRFAIEYGEDVDDSQLWKIGAHRADWAEFSHRLQL